METGKEQTTDRQAHIYALVHTQMVCIYKHIQTQRGELPVSVKRRRQVENAQAWRKGYKRKRPSVKKCDC